MATSKRGSVRPPGNPGTGSPGSVRPPPPPDSALPQTPGPPPQRTRAPTGNHSAAVRAPNARPPIARTAVGAPRGQPQPAGASRAPALGSPRGRPLPAPLPSSRKPNVPADPLESEPDHDATSIMNRPQIEASLRAMQPASRAPAPQATQRVAPHRASGSGAMPPREERMPPRTPPPVSQRTAPPNRLAPESAGAIALPRPPVLPPLGSGTSAMSRPPVSQRTAPPPQGTVRTTGSVRKPASLPPTPKHGSAPPPRSAEPPPLDDLVPRSRSERPRHTRPPVSHRSQPPRDRPRFGDRSPEPRAPGGGLPGPDSFGRLPAPLQASNVPQPPSFPPPASFPSPSNFPPASGPDATMAMARSPYAAVPQPKPGGEYYPPPQPAPRAYAPPPGRDRDPNEYYPHLGAQHPAAPPHVSGGYDRYPPPGYLAPGDPRGRAAPASMSSSIGAAAYPPALLPQDSRLPVPGSAPYPYVAPPIENPSFMGLVLFAAPLALATLAVAALALM